ncbi:MAG: hypothetical protein U0872_03815 [Planctomycetaceae bacterium]
MCKIRTTFAVKLLLSQSDGVDSIFDRREQRQFGLDHERSGNWWRSTHAVYWFVLFLVGRQARGEDYARTVDIHRKPGYDPVELFIDPKLPLACAWPAG